jgi:hypothetical protein
MIRRFALSGFALTLGCAIGLTASVSPGSAGPTVATKWRLTGAPQSDCLGYAGAAIFKAGFDDTGPTSQSRTGRRGDYTASIRCVSEQRMVFFVVSGPDAREVAQLIDRLYERF